MSQQNVALCNAVKYCGCDLDESNQPQGVSVRVFAYQGKEGGTLNLGISLKQKRFFHEINPVENCALF